MPYSLKRFSFRLQTLLNIEQNKEKQAQIVFQNAMNEQQRQEQILAEQELEYQREQAAMAQAMRQGAPPQGLSVYDMLFKGLNARMKTQQQTIDEAAQAVEAAREALAERSKQRKVLEKLKENAREQYDEEARRIETTVFDEIGTIMTVRKAKE